MLRMLTKTHRFGLALFFFSLLWLAGIPFKEVDAVSRPACSEVIAKFFPTSLVATNFGTISESYVPYVTAGKEQCAHRIINQTSRTRSTDPVFVSVSTGDPKARLNCASGRRAAIGDDSCIYDNGGRAKKNNFIFEVNAYIYVYPPPVQLKKVSSEIERLLAYAVTQVADLPGPTIDTITPSATTAGVRMGYHEKTGIVVYGISRQAFEITGQNLTGSLVKSDHKNVDESGAIQFSQIRISPDGRRLRGTMHVSPKARDGTARITVTNLSGKSAVAEVSINITGTQYLKRKFANQKISFYGDWPGLMPNQEALQVETQVYEGLEAVDKPSYRSLGLSIFVYEYENLWKNHAAMSVCGQQWAGGCMTPGSKVVHVRTGERFGRYILHEFAHELHFSFVNSFTYVRGLREKIVDQFGSEWKTAVGDTSQCRYLPLSAYNKWADGSESIPRCGFAWAYGANKASSAFPPFAEDIATMVVSRKFEPGIFQTGDGPTDPRYPLKYNLLDRYGF